jgi:hypothetical protein
MLRGAAFFARYYHLYAYKWREDNPGDLHNTYSLGE